MIQVCGIVPKCLNCTMLHEKVNPNFDYFDIVGNFNKPSSVMPVGLNNELYPLMNFQYEKINLTFVILSTETYFFNLMQIMPCPNHFGLVQFVLVESKSFDRRKL